MPWTPEQMAMLALKREAHGVYLTNADHLRVSSWCSLSTVTQLTITGRFLTCEGILTTIGARHVPNTDRTIANTIHALGEGWLLDLRIVSDGAPLLGQVFVRAEIVRGLSGGVTPLRVLAQGVCNAVQALAWPGTRPMTSHEAPSALRAVVGTDPAAGAESSETVPTGARWRILMYAITLVADATVATRLPKLMFDDGANLLFHSRNPGQRTASGSCDFVWGHGVPANTADTANYGSTGTPTDYWLLAGHRFFTTTASLQGGDNYGPPRYLVEEKLEAAA